MPKREEQNPSPKNVKRTDIVYAIPSYRREGLIQTHTLKMLHENGVATKDIFIFVSDIGEYKRYRSALGERFDLINTDSRNIVQKFNSVHNYFPEGTRVVFIEDDISELKRKIGENKLGPFDSLESMAEYSFEKCAEVKTNLWGISSNANPFYMDDRVAVGFKFVVANLFGFISTKDKFLEVSQICKSDYERTLLYYVKYGCIVRNDGVCAITKNYKNEGGLQTLSDRGQKEKESCEALVKRFPHLVEINEKKSKISKYMELKLKLAKKKQMTDLFALQRIMDKNL